MDGVAVCVGDDHDFAGPGDHVDVAQAARIAQLLGGGHIDVAGADDLVHLGHGLRAEGQRGDGLRPARAHHRAHAGELCGRQNGGGYLAVRAGRGGHDDGLYPGDFGRNGVHQHAGRIPRRAAGHIEPGAGQRKHALSHHHTWRGRIHKAGALLQAVEPLDISRGQPERIQKFRLHLGKRRVQLFLRHQKAVGPRAVECFAIVQHGFIAAQTHILHNGFHCLRHVALDLGGAVQKLGGGLSLIGYDADHGRSSF